jgi:ABC-type glycerol-3-phosphate transport system substrate-binding protein
MRDGVRSSGSELDASRMDRREFLRLAGLVGGQLAAISLLASCGGRGTPGGAAGGAPGDTSGGVGQAAGSPRLVKPEHGTGGGPPLVFRGWNYHPEVVEDNVRKFNATYGENVDYQTVAGDYGSLMEKMHINREPLHFAYANPQTAHRWYKAGWIWDLEGMWSVDQVKKDLYPGWREIVTTKDGKLLGLPYFQSVRGTICTNEEMLQKVGITPKEYPKTWEELYEQLYQIKKANLTDVPFLPHWFATSWFGLGWGYQFECMNRGAVLFDDEGRPVFDQKCYDILESYRQLLADGIVPSEVFTMQETDFIDGFASGRYAYSPQQTYDSKVFNDPTRSRLARGGTNPEARGSMYVPVDKQPWGLIDSGIYVAIKRPEQDEKTLARTWRLQEFFGYKDADGNFYVSKRWALERALNSGYPSTLEDPDVQAAYRQWMPDPDFMMPAMKSILSSAKSPPVWKRYFYEEWNSKALTELSQAILGQKGTREALDGLKTHAEQLLEKSKRVDPD